MRAREIAARPSQFVELAQVSSLSQRSGYPKARLSDIGHCGRWRESGTLLMFDEPTCDEEFKKMLSPMFWLAFIAVFCGLRLAAAGLVRIGDGIRHRMPSHRLAVPSTRSQGNAEGVVVSLKVPTVGAKLSNDSHAAGCHRNAA